MIEIIIPLVANAALCAGVVAWQRWYFRGLHREVLAAIEQVRVEVEPSERQTATAESAEETVSPPELAEDTRRPSEPRLLRMVCHPIRCDKCRGPLRDGDLVVTNDVKMAHLKCVVRVHDNERRNTGYHELNYTITDAEWEEFFGEKKS